MKQERSRLLSDRDIAHCKSFAENCYSTNKDEYARRGQHNESKIIEDIKIGKMAEIAVYFYLTQEKKLTCSQPDFVIYPAKQKNYGADLTIHKDDILYDMHVKCQSVEQANRFGTSWLFQKKDSLTHTPKENEMICFCTVDSNTVYIKHIFMAKNLVPVYKEPKLKELKSNKLAIYEDSLSTLLS